MKRNARKAFNAIRRLGAAVYDRSEHSAEFILGAERLRDNDPKYADSYQEEIRERVEDGKVINAMGIDERINRILRNNGLHAEWINPAMVGIYAD